MKLCHLILLFLTLPSICLAELNDENLLQTLPTGYKIDFQTKKDGMLMAEMVPQAETVNDWTEMLTTQVFMGMKNITIEQFQNRMGSLWLSSCKDGQVFATTQGEENGYPFSVWLQTCPLNPTTEKQENTWFKAIKGNDSFYLVQKAFKFTPSTEQAEQWMKYFSSIIVCDTRLADHPCPKLEKVVP